MLAWAVAIAIAAGAFEPFYLRIFTINRPRFAAMLTELPYHKLPGLRPFLLGVQQHTSEGDAVALSAPLHRGIDEGYEYYYARALYLLPGRRIVPLIDANDHPQPQNLAAVTFVAAYHTDAAVPGFAVIWRDRNGALLRRIP